MLGRVKQFWRQLLQKIAVLFRRPITGSDELEPRESIWKALKDFLNRYPRYIISLIITALLPLLIAFLFFLILTINKPSLQVPQLEGLSILDAASILQEKNISIAIIPEISSVYPENYIIHQDIKAGRTIKEGRKLLLYVSSGSSEVSFPSFVGKDFYNVKIRAEHQPLSMKTFQIQNVYWQNSSRPFGEILLQSPSSGNYRNFPIAVNFTVSNGATTTVPSFVGQYSLSANYAIKQLGFTPHILFEKTSNPSQDGRVIRQNPAAQTDTFPKMNIQLVVGRYNTDIQYFQHTVTSDLNGRTIGLIINDNRGQRILFLGTVQVGDVIEAAAPMYGKWKAGIYLYEGDNNKTLYKDLTV